MTTTKRVGILTGGGDVPGVNMCLKSLVYHLIDLGFEPIGIRKGWEGLINYNPADPSTYSDYFIELTKNGVRPIDRTPGSFLHSSRLDPRQTPRRLIPEFLREDKKEVQDLTNHICSVVQLLGYQGLVVIGDDDMLHYAAFLSQKGVPVVAIPKTIHNNIQGTDYSLGSSTGLGRGVAFIHELRALAGSREQVMVVETFAAKSGYSTLLMSFLGGADRVLIPEVHYDPDRLAYLVTQDRRQNPSNYAVIMVCNGTRPVEEKRAKYAHLITLTAAPELSQAANHETEVDRQILELHDGIMAGEKLIGSGMIAAQLLAHITGEEVFLQPLTYLLRTGMPDGQDLLGGANFAITAARLVKEGHYGRMTAFVHNKMWTDVDLKLAMEGLKTVDVNQWYDQDNYKAKLSLIWSAEGE
jgi:6-phosphofructokinase